MSVVFGSVLFTAIVLVLALTVLGARRILLPDRMITVRVNGTREIQAHAGGKLLDVLQEDGIPIPSACAGKGTCGLCRVGVPEGGGDPLPSEVGKLKRQELRDHVRLACQVVAREDMEVTVAEDLFGVRTFACEVVSNRTVAPFIKELVLKPIDSDEPFTFEPGSFVQATAPAYDLDFARMEVEERHRGQWDLHDIWSIKLANPEPVIRAYSIASTPDEDGTIVLNIRLALPAPGDHDAPPGIVSSYLFSLKAGETVDVSGPYGTFRAQDTDREMVFIGGGVGMAPLRAIITDQLERRNTSRKMSYWYGARSRIELFYDDAFNDLAARHENFSWTVALSDPLAEDNWEGDTGFIHTVALENYLRDHPAPEDCEYYLCGPPLMIRAVLGMLDDLGVEADCIFNDDFGT